MSEKTPTLDELIRNTALITEALNRATREAVLRHAREGLTVSTWRDGRVVHVSPEEILARYGPKAPPTNPAQ